MPILGLLDSEQFSSERFTNIRREVFYRYPNGAAPLVGLTSMIKQEETNDPEYSWYEKELDAQTSLTRTSTPVTTDAPTAPWTGGTSLGASAHVANTTYWIKVDSSQRFRVNHVLLNKTTGQQYQVTAITNSSATLGVLEVRALNAATNISAASQELTVIGNMAQQGALSTTGIWNPPTSIGNYTQIFRSPFIPITGTAMKTAAKFDESGPYKDMAKETSIYQMTEMEKQFIFGAKTKYVPSGQAPLYTTGGIISYLTNGADTADATCVITNATGTIDQKTFEGYLERCFRVTNNKANEKIGFCGSGFLSILNQMYGRSTCFTTDLPMRDTYGMDVVKHVTPFGTVYWKTHPLFSQDNTWRFNGLIVDIHNLIYRYVSGRDGILRKNIQANDADYRKDEWLTEAGLELRFKDSHMYIQNVRNFVA